MKTLCFLLVCAMPLLFSCRQEEERSLTAPSSDEQALAAHETPDGGCMIAGTRTTNGVTRLMTFGVDPLGEPLWQHELELDTVDEIAGILSEWEAGWLIFGITHGGALDTLNTIRVDSAGREIWSMQREIPALEDITRVRKAYDRNIGILARGTDGNLNVGTVNYDDEVVFEEWNAENGRLTAMDIFSDSYGSPLVVGVYDNIVGDTHYVFASESNESVTLLFPSRTDCDGAAVAVEGFWGKFVIGATSTADDSPGIGFCHIPVWHDPKPVVTIPSTGCVSVSHAFITPSHKIVVAGTAKDFGDDFFLMQTDSAGTLLWMQTDYTLGDQQLLGFEPLDNGGFILFGTSAGTSVDGSVDAYVVKTDASGNILWSRTYGYELK